MINLKFTKLEDDSHYHVYYDSEHGCIHKVLLGSECIHHDTSVAFISDQPIKGDDLILKIPGQPDGLRVSDGIEGVARISRESYIWKIERAPSYGKRRRRWLSAEGYKTVWITENKVLVMGTNGKCDHYCTIRRNKHDEPYVVFGNTRYYVDKRREYK